MTLNPFIGSTSQRWLDIGCGRGGTAAFIEQMKWAEVTGFDIDAITIEDARKIYPHVAFHACGVTDVSRTIAGEFDLLYSFNAFYAFPDLAKALTALRPLAAKSAKLAIFDYVDRGGFYESKFSRLPEVAHWHPIEEDSLRATMKATGWEMDEHRNLDADYARWYAHLVSRFDSRREALREIAPIEVIDYSRNIYAALLSAIGEGVMGGGIFNASAC
ncbi:MAG: class I SAM-dependent methyltransferase [Chthoniobacterales bacterium]